MTDNLRLAAIGRPLRIAGLLLGAAALASAAAALAQAPAEPQALPGRYSPDGDPYFAEPYIDVDEWRDAPVRHR